MTDMFKFCNEIDTASRNEDMSKFPLGDAKYITFHPVQAVSAYVRTHMSLLWQQYKISFTIISKVEMEVVKTFVTIYISTNDFEIFVSTFS